MKIKFFFILIIFTLLFYPDAAGATGFINIKTKNYGNKIFLPYWNRGKICLMKYMQKCPALFRAV